ncbi:FMP42 protein [Xylariaceae sp. FL0804]|nr:FMP42 protein [Xylariaceae sp. FL0804]
MSLPRVSALETYFSNSAASSVDGERSRRGSGSSAAASSVRAHRLSFNPLPESWDPVVPRAADHPGQPVGAFEVPRWKRIVQITCAVVYCLFAAGVVFGYAALKPVLKREGAYREVCDGRDTCVEIRLNLMFTVAAVATNVAALPVGAILDYYGPRVCGLLGAACLTVGALLMAFARRLPFDAFLPGYLFLALGGPFTYISSFQLSNAFPQHSGLILALLTGAFDSSSAMFLVYRVVFDRTGGAFGHEQFFLAYLAVPVLIVVLQLTVMPRQSYKTVGEMMDDAAAAAPPVFQDSFAPSSPSSDRAADDQVDEHTALLRDERRRNRELTAAQGVEELVGAASADKQARQELAAARRSGVWGAMHDRPALEQMRSPWFVLICLFTVVQMTRINYFVATVRPQYRALLGSEAAAAAVNHFFDAALPIGGLLSIPLVGAVLDRASTVAVLAALVAVATAIGVLGVLPLAWAAYANVCLFVLYRPFYYTAVSDYSAKVFGFRTFGTVYGAVICLAGLLNLGQSGLDYLFHETCAGDPVPVNLALMALGLLVGLALVAYVALQTRRLRRKREGGYANGIGDY